MTDPKPLPWDAADLDALRPRAKAALRKRLRALRASHPPAVRAERSAAIARAVLALDAWQKARVVAVFSAMDEEVDTAALIADARARGLTVCLPCVTDADGPLTFRVAWSPAGDQPLVAGVWGIEEPGADAPVVALDAHRRRRRPLPRRGAHGAPPRLRPRLLRPNPRPDAADDIRRGRL